MIRRARTRWRHVAAAAACVVLVSGCRLTTEIGIDVDEDGSGTVTVGVGLDGDAVRQLPDIDRDGESTGRDLRRMTRTDDLEASGWTIVGPVVEDGVTWLRASKPFGTAAELTTVMDEIAGSKGPFRDFALTRDSELLETAFGFRGTVDFTRGLESFSDPEVTEALGGEPLGEDAEAIEKRLGAAFDELFTVRVAVRLPGEVESNAPTQADNGAVWQPRVSGESVTLSATSETRHTGALLWAGVAVVAGFALLLLLLVRLAGWVRRRRTT